jgi:hypothetical protein
MTEEPRSYRAYLVRLWQARSGGQVVWRVSAEDAHSGERQAFAGLAQLFLFLEEQTARYTTGRPPAVNQEQKREKGV